MWFILSLIVGITFAANRVIVRAVFTKHENPMTFGAVHELLAGLLLLPIGLFSLSFPHSLHIWVAFLIGIFCIFLSDLFSFLSLRHIEASLYQIINQLRHIVVLFGAAVLFSEAITFIKIISIIFIMLGIIVALKGKSKITLNKGVLFACINTFCIAVGLLFIKEASVDVSATFSSPLALLVSGMLMSSLVLARGQNIKSFLPTTHRKALLLAALLFALFELTLFWALAVGEASRVTPVTQSSIIFTLIGGYLFLHERNHMQQKLGGIVLIAFGIVLLYLF